MLITKFNKWIRSRILWGIFAVVISVMFIGTFSPTRGGCSNQQDRNKGLGLLFDKPVTPIEFNRSRFFELGLKEAPSLTPEMAERLRMNVLKRIAALRAAEKMGITVSDEEVTAAIKQDPAYADNGVFNPQKYKLLLLNWLKVPNAVGIFETYVREQITLKKLQQTMDSATWTSPIEINDRLASFADSFALEYVSMDVSNNIPKITFTDDDAREFFADNKEYFEIPAKVSVKYVEFPFSNLLAKATITDDQISEYYSDHSHEYSTTDTNETSTPIPLDEVKDDITAILKRESAVATAKDSATEFLMELMPDRAGNAKKFENAALERGLSINTTMPFSIRENISGLKVDRSFNREAFDLDPTDPVKCFGDAIVGTDAVYIVAANTKTEPRIPEYDEVKDKVLPLAKRKAELKAFSEKTISIRKSLQTSLDAGKTFREAAKELKMNVSTTRTFRIYEDTDPSETNEIPYFDAFVPKIISLKKGAVSEPIMASNVVLVAYVADRQPGDSSTMNELRPRILGALDGYRAGIVFSEWSNYMLGKGGFTNTAPREAQQPYEAEENAPVEDNGLNYL